VHSPVGDLRRPLVDDLGTALAASGHDPSRATLFVAEAVLPYLPATAVELALRAMSERRGRSGRLAVELGSHRTTSSRG